jgi:cytochrome d ubiquinol oxidase subunit I
VAIIYWSFRIMVGAGFVMAALALYALFMVMGEMVESGPRSLRLFLWALILPYLANSFGWLLTELGRSPWVVYGLMKIENATSPTVSSGMVLISLVGFTLVYGLLMVADIYLLSKYARAGISSDSDAPQSDSPEAMPSLVGAD